jgi:hypothetical protein
MERLNYHILFKNKEIKVQIVAMGKDYNVICYGGDVPHIGAVTMSIPRPSLENPDIISCTTSVLVNIGHKDDILARVISEKLSVRENAVVTCACGIHYDNITKAELKELMDEINEILGL